MRIAVFSDVHGNAAALEAVLADLEKQGSFNEVVFAGDACLFGSRPGISLALLQQHTTTCIYGNTDEWLFTPLAITAEMSESVQERIGKIHAFADWAKERLSPDLSQWLKSWPFEHRISPTSDPADDLLVVHANPLDTMKPIYPSEEDQQTRYDKLVQPDAELVPLLGGTTAQVMAYGHLHIPNIRQWQGMTLANISSVSLPGDGDVRAKYVIFTWQDGRWEYEYRYVAYDYRVEVAGLDGVPGRGIPLHTWNHLTS